MLGELVVGVVRVGGSDHLITTSRLPVTLATRLELEFFSCCVTAVTTDLVHHTLLVCKCNVASKNRGQEAKIMTDSFKESVECCWVSCMNFLCQVSMTISRVICRREIVS